MTDACVKRVVVETPVVRVNLGVPGPRGETGPTGPAGGATKVVTAGASIGGHRVVVLNAAEEAIYADNSDLTHVDKVLGLSLGAAAIGDQFNVIRLGDVSEPSWNWALDQPVFLSTAGQLTQVPPTTGFLLVVGFPIAPTKLYVDIGESVVL